MWDVAHTLPGDAGGDAQGAVRIVACVPPGEGGPQAAVAFHASDASQLVTTGPRQVYFWRLVHEEVRRGVKEGPWLVRCAGVWKRMGGELRRGVEEGWWMCGAGSCRHAAKYTLHALEAPPCG